MNIRGWIVGILLINPIYGAFLSNKHYRKLRLKYNFYMKKNEHLVLKTKTNIIENMASIVKDDLSNDLLYFMKFYHLSQDDNINYLYIIFYELLSLCIRNEEKTILNLHLSMLNITIYILIKNIMINQYIHHHGP